MRISRMFWAAVVGSFIAAQPAAGAPPARDHPVLGTWKITSPDGSCSELYRFRPDGTVLVTSGEEVAEIDSRVSATASARGFYRWEQKLTRDNGKRDCSGKVMKQGDAFTWFIQFDQSLEKMIVCKAESTQACFGPLQRVRATAP
jgi:hypothetical protein